MPAQTQIKSYLFLQYNSYPALQAFVNSFNAAAQDYLTYLNNLNMPIYTGLSGTVLDWCAAGIYGLKRPTIGTPSGAVYNVATYNLATYDVGTTGAITVSDDYYKRILTWRLWRGDGFVMSTNWLKRRLKRFLVGANGISPAIDNTYEVSVFVESNSTIRIVINYPSDLAAATMLVACLEDGILGLPWQYNVDARIA